MRVSRQWATGLPRRRAQLQARRRSRLEMPRRPPQARAQAISMGQLLVGSSAPPELLLGRTLAGKKDSARGTLVRQPPRRASSPHHRRRCQPARLWSMVTRVRPMWSKQQCRQAILRPRWAPRRDWHQEAAPSRRPAPQLRDPTAQCLHRPLRRLPPSTAGRPSPRLRGGTRHPALPPAPPPSGLRGHGRQAPRTA